MPLIILTTIPTTNSISVLIVAPGLRNIITLHMHFITTITLGITATTTGTMRIITATNRQITTDRLLMVSAIRITFVPTVTTMLIIQTSLAESPCLLLPLRLLFR